MWPSWVFRMKDVDVIYVQYIKNTELRATVQPPLSPLTKCCKVLAVACHLNDSTSFSATAERRSGWMEYRGEVPTAHMDGWFFLTLWDCYTVQYISPQSYLTHRREKTIALRPRSTTIPVKKSPGGFFRKYGTLFFYVRDSFFFRCIWRHRCSSERPLSSVLYYWQFRILRKQSDIHHLPII